MIRIALIGFGKMGISHLAILGAHPDVTVAAVCDQNKHVLDLYKTYSSANIYTDHNEMLQKEQLDAVVIATPSRFHADIVRAALQHSVHVFCEKPFCLDPVEGAELTALAESKNLVNHVGYHYRQVGTFSHAKRLLDSGAIGRVHNIRAEAYGPVVLRPKGATWRSSKAEGGGCLYDYASHALDIMNFLVGSPTEVRGTALTKVFSRDVDDEVYSSLFYANGMVGQIAANWSDESQRKMSMKVNLYGEGGKIEADRQELKLFIRDEATAKAHGLNKGWNIKYTTDLTEPVSYYLRGEEYSAQIADFVDAVAGKTNKAISTFRTALETDILIGKLLEDAAGISAPVRQPVAAPAKKGLFGALIGAMR